MSDDTRIAKIKSELLSEGYELVGPHQSEDSKHGWFAPIVPSRSRGGSAPYGWGQTRLEAVEDALQIFRGRAPR